ncbi:hypothetical protein BJ322DRAFT_1218157 [Thelephora terrestris]|uniref:NACHT domain-containing protein n=1 Tax=Thelephora terrestris TaxID=56493 RepID=A0A9P6HI83_9AGAM|nr:hypothetical protein BJ322DRAFT_1218157 [Thelephora terrestris]
MAKKKSNKPLKTSTSHLLLGISANIAAGPLGFRAELDLNPADEKNPTASRIVFCERQSEAEGPPAPGTSYPVVAIGDTEQPLREPSAPGTSDPVVAISDADAEQLENQLIGGSTDQTREEEGEPGVASVEQDNGNTAPVSPVLLTGGVTSAPSGFGSLEALLGGIPAIDVDHEESGAIRNKIEVLYSHIVSLNALFSKPPDDVGDQRRRNQLIRHVMLLRLNELKGIEGKLRSLCENPGLQPPADRVQGDENVFRLLEDLQQAIHQYQTADGAANDDRKSRAQNNTVAAILDRFRSAQRAEYRHGDRNGCLRRTRGAILDEIELWTNDFQKPSVFWLNGLAGTGKSTIAQTIAERMFAHGRLGASFFCSRDFEDRSNLRSIFPTLAVQLARNYPEFRSIFLPLVQADPEIIHESLYGQMNKLIARPLVEAAISTLIVIDALDECKDEEPASAILSVLGQFVAEIPNVKFFVTGRPEPRIREGFRLPLEVEPSRVNSDIRVFFQHKFSEIRGRNHGLDGWPTEEQLDLLCGRTGGLFVYAIATVRFIVQRNITPRKQLDRLLRSPDSRFEGKTNFKVNTTLNSLYTTILQDAFGDTDPEDDPRIRSVIGAVILATNPLSLATIAALLSFDTEDILHLLSSLHSLLVLQEDIDHPVRPFHKFRVHPPDQHGELLVHCLEVMNRGLEKNMCKLPDGVTNSEVINLKERTKKHINQALQYACQSWYKHLIHTIPSHSPNIVPVLCQFLKVKFLFWLEVLSILGTAREAVDALKVTEKWLNTWPSPDLDPILIEDYIHFIITFFEVISVSTPHIYHTALPLSPQGSTVRKLYKQHACPLVRVVHGLPFSWKPIAATRPYKHLGSVTAWSPCNRFIAITGHYDGAHVKVIDAVTLKQLSTLKSPKHLGIYGGWLSFSPDSRLLTQCHEGRLISWDLQTGGPLSVIPETVWSSYMDPSITYSVDGKMIAVAHCSVSHNKSAIFTYNLLSRAHVHSYIVQDGYFIEPIWTCGNYIQFATMKPGSITIWEVEFSSESGPVEVVALLFPDKDVLSLDKAQLPRGLKFLPTHSRLAFTLQHKVMIWDAQHLQLLLNFTAKCEVLEASFSSNACFFMCKTREGVHIWKESPVGYLLHQTLISRTPYELISPCFSPDGGSIAVVHESSVRLWSTRDPIIPPSSILGQSLDLVDFLPTFSLDEALVAVIQPEENKVTIFDLESNNPQLVIDAGMRISCVRLNSSVVVIANCEDSALNARVSIEDSVHMATFDGLAQPLVLLEPLKSPHISISPDLNYVAIMGVTQDPFGYLKIYDMWTGRYLTCTLVESGWVPYFTPDGHEVWFAQDLEPVDGWTIIEGSSPCLKRLEPGTLPSGVFPWKSSCGYEVTHDGWVLSPTKKRLVWLPYHWWQSREKSIWQGRFLGFLHVFVGLLDAISPISTSSQHVSAEQEYSWVFPSLWARWQPVNRGYEGYGPMGRRWGALSTSMKVVLSHTMPPSSVGTLGYPKKSVQAVEVGTGEQGLCGLESDGEKMGCPVNVDEGGP